MNRDELRDQMVTALWSWRGPDEIPQTVADLAEALLPVLAQVWQDGWNTGQDDHFLTRADTPNPYREVPTESSDTQNMSTT